MTRKGLWVVVLALLFTAGCAKPELTAEGYVSRGIEFATRGEWDPAVADFTWAIKLDRKMAAAYVLRGRALFASAVNGTAVGEDFSGVSVSNAGEVTGAQKKTLDQAIADYTQALALEPDNAIAYRERGRAHAYRGDSSAIHDYDQAIKLDPNYAAAYHSRGHAYYDKKDYDRAIADYDQAIELDPNDALTYIDRGNAYLDKGDNDSAIADCTQAIKLDPNDAVAYYKRGNVYLGKKSYNRAIADYTQAIKLNPNYLYAYNNRGVAYDEQGDHDRALADFTQAVKLDPNNATAKRNFDRLSVLSNALSVTSRGLLAEYKANEARADSRYKNKTVKVTGEVTGIRDASGKYYVSLEGDGLFNTVDVYVKPFEVNKIANLNVGETVTMVGTCEGSWMGSVSIGDATLVK